VRIAAAGGGIRFNVRGRSTDDLVRIAAAASTGGARLFLSGMSGRSTDDLIKIAAAGKGSVVFEGKLTAGRSGA
jgi:DNA replication protein